MVLRVTFILLVATSLACGRFDRRHTPHAGVAPPAPLEAKAALYLAHRGEVEDRDGAVDTAGCDGGHWTALRRAAGVPAVNLRAFLEPNHRVHRRPLTYGECYPGESKSTVSGDELLYFLAAGLVTSDLALLRDIFAYGKDHDFVMGDGDRARVLMRPSLQGLYARVLKKLGGPTFGETLLPDPQFPGQTGFAAQLQVVAILLEGRVDGAISDSYLARLKEHAERQPHNALFACAAAHWGGADPAVGLALLGTAKWWPDDRLPSSADRCEGWLTQRDEGKDWEPCPEERKVHHGGDFLFAYAVCKGLI